jgi:DNA modification methylase
MEIKDKQLELIPAGLRQEENPPNHRKNGRANKLDSKDRAIHDWYRFVLSYPPHLVREYIEKFGLGSRNTILDPFCGTGTTLVEAKLQNVKSVGVEANPFAQFAASVKVDWEINPELLMEQANEIAYNTLNLLKLQGLDDNALLSKTPATLDLRKLEPEAEKLILTNSISPLPLHKTLLLLDCMKPFESQPFYRHALLALGNALVFRISNLHFGPEVGVRNPKIDVPVVGNWLLEIVKIFNDLKNVQLNSYPASNVYSGDARQIDRYIRPNSIDAVITSPPYPNEKDYTRTTRLESVLLGFIKSRTDLRALKAHLVRSNTRNVYKNDDDDLWVAGHEEIQQIANNIEKRRIELEKDSGFERLYSRVAKLYFGGMARHLGELRKVLKPGAKLAYVVGDQASYLRVMIKTGKLTAEIAEQLGYIVEGIDLFRTRLATATREQLREEVVRLTWTGKVKR